MNDDSQNGQLDLLSKLEKANKQLENALTRIAELEARLRRDDVSEIVREALVEEPYSAKWGFMTICDDPKSAHREDSKITECLNEGWQIVEINFAQSAVMTDGVLEIQRTRVVNLQRVTFEKGGSTPPKDEGKEAELSVQEALTPEIIPTPDPSPLDGEGNKETVIEPELEPVPVMQVLPENMVIVDMLPEELLVEREEFAGMSYAEAIKDPRTTQEDLAAIHKRVSAEREAVRSVKHRQEWDEKIAAWREKWQHAGMPFEVPQPSWYTK